MYVGADTIRPNIAALSAGRLIAAPARPFIFITFLFREEWKHEDERQGTLSAPAIALFVCAAVYLNWSYEQEAAGKTLGESTLVGKEDPLLGGGADSSSSGAAEGDGQTGEGAQAQEGTSQTGAASSDYFSTARLNRQQSRDSALALLQDAAGEDADQTLKDEANETIQAMADYTVTEAQIENLVIAKGYADCVAFIGENALSLAVAAPEGGLTDTDTARIVDVVHQTTGFTADQVKIISVDPQA